MRSLREEELGLPDCRRDFGFGPGWCEHEFISMAVLNSEDLSCSLADVNETDREEEFRLLSPVRVRAVS